MHLFITGATGFFGKALLPYLHSIYQTSLPGLTATILSRNPAAFQRDNPLIGSYSWLQFRQGDILDPISFQSSIEFTHILHAATDSTAGPTLTPIQRFSQIVDGTRNLLDFACDRRISRFLYISSGGVYGVQPSEMAKVAEDWPYSPDLSNPANAYGLAKRAAEHLCHLYAAAHGVEVVIARCFAFVGPAMPLDAHFAIGNFIRDALSQPVITVAGDGAAVRSYLEQSDLSQWLWVMLLQGSPSEAYNVGSDQAITIAQLATLVRDLLAPEKEVRILGKTQPTGSRSRYVPDITKARMKLGLDVKVSLTEAIVRTASSVQSSSTKWY